VATGPQPITASSIGTICAHGALSLQASSSPGVYSWTGPNGFTSPAQNPTIFDASAAATGTYSVTVTVNGCTSAAATASATVTALGGACTDGNTCTVGDACAYPNTVSESFDSVPAPALPSGWSTAASGGSPWSTTTAIVLSAPNSATTDEPANVSDKSLDTPAFIMGYGAVLEFDNRYNLESTFDGAVVEIKIGAAAFTDIVTAGGSFSAGGYNATISTLFSSPIAGRQAWSAASGGFAHTIVNLPPAAAGQSVILRFRVASDVSLSAASPNGQWIDNVVVHNSVCQPGPPLTCDDANVCTNDSCDPVSGCAHANNTAACADGNACTTGDTCRGGVCSGGTSAPSEFIVNGDFESGTGTLSCGPNPLTRNNWVGTGSAIQYTGCPWTASVVTGLGFPGGNAPGTISESFAATPGPGTLSYQHGSDAPTSCSYTVTFAPSNTVVNVNAQLVAAMVAAPTIAVPAGTTSVTFANPNCSGGSLDLLNFDNVSIQAGVATVLNCDDVNGCTDDSCNPALGCVHANNTAACNDGNPCTVGDTCGAGVCVSGPTVTSPPETQNVVVAADKATYSWTAAAFATQYDVVRGSTAAFPVGPGGGDEVCFDNLPGTTFNDLTVPAPGAGFWYLSRGENACGIGTFGTQTGGSPRITTTCP
jgi:hypothetical protein